MSNRTLPTATGVRFQLPFLVADVILLVAAALIFEQGHRPMTVYETVAFAACVALGCCLSVWPFFLRQRAEERLSETDALADTLAQIQRLEEVAQTIVAANTNWQVVQEHATRAVSTASELAESLSQERSQFQEFLGQANDSERQHLRLEVEKLHRAESEWLQVLVRILDHVYALFVAAVHSGQPNLQQQLTNFQNACRDVARRVGLVAVVVDPGTPFDANVHQPADTTTPPPVGAMIAETLATGYSFQGQLVRRPLVALRPPPAGQEPAVAEPPHAEPNALPVGESEADPGTPPQANPPPTGIQSRLDLPTEDAGNPEE